MLSQKVKLEPELQSPQKIGQPSVLAYRNRESSWRVYTTTLYVTWSWLELGGLSVSLKQDIYCS